MHSSDIEFNARLQANPAIDDKFKELILSSVQAFLALPEDLRTSGVSLTVSSGRTNGIQVYSLTCADIQRTIHLREDEDGLIQYHSSASDAEALIETHTLEDAYQVSRHVSRIDYMRRHSSNEEATALFNAFSSAECEHFEELDDHISRVMDDAYDEDLSNDEIQIHLDRFPSEIVTMLEERIKEIMSTTSCSPFSDIASQDVFGYTTSADKLDVYLRREHREWAGCLVSHCEINSQPVDIKIQYNIYKQHEFTALSAETSEHLIKDIVAGAEGIDLPTLHKANLSLKDFIQIYSNPISKHAMHHGIFVPLPDSDDSINSMKVSNRRV